MFHFKKFSIDDTHCAMKVGTDAVLLGAWSALENAQNILDVGAGSGILSLMAAQRNEQAQIFAIELDKSACEDAKKNILNSSWRERIHVENQLFQNFAIETALKFDFIICNPPFFSQSLRAADKQRNMARHDDLLPACELLSGIARLLNDEGSAALIIPTNYLEKFTIEAAIHSLFTAKKTFVKSTINHNAHRVLIEFEKKNNTSIQVSEFIIYSKPSIYTEEYRALCRNFYLKF